MTNQLTKLYAWCDGEWVVASAAKTADLAIPRAIHVSTVQLIQWAADRHAARLCERH